MPSRNAATRPATAALTENTTSLPSTNVAAVATSQTIAGAANGKRRRHSNGSTTSAIAGAANHGELVGASGASSLKITSSDAATAPITTSASNPYVRPSIASRLTC